MRNVANNSIMLSVFMLSVVAPTFGHDVYFYSLLENLSHSYLNRKPNAYLDALYVTCMLNI
jgi:hypothetical protein